MKPPKRKYVLSITFIIIFIIIDLIYIGPLYLLIGMSFGMKIWGEQKEFIPLNFSPLGYIKIFSQPNFFLWVRNSFIYSILITIGSLVIASLTGYAFSRLDFPGKEYLFWLILAGMMVPSIIYYIPLFVLLSKLKLINTIIGITIPPIGSAYSAFLLKQAFEGVPKDFDEAAIIDGADRLDIIFRIILPIVKPSLITLGLFNFVWSWNNFAWPLFVATRSDMFTLPLAILVLSYGGYQYFIEFNIFAAGAVICMLVPLVLFLVATSYFLRGIIIAGLKK
jgi:ABC-type glycerol-3-phosphate transport system permease component